MCCFCWLLTRSLWAVRGIYYGFLSRVISCMGVALPQLTKFVGFFNFNNGGEKREKKERKKKRHDIYKESRTYWCLYCV